LKNSGEFKKVYAGGRRFEGKLLTVYLLPNDGPLHRLGITASKKAVGNAVQRNRAKRLLREAFRLNADAIHGLGIKYDWVLNARRYLLRVKLQEPLTELGEIVARVALSESAKPEALGGRN